MFSTIKAFFYVLILSILTFTINAQLTGTWPTLDKPPQPKAEWTSLVDMSKVPNAPIVKVVGQNCPATDTYCNWSCTGCVRNDSDIIQCPSKTDWGLTFDDGPTAFTTGLLDYFDTTQQQVSFFIVGSRVVENPQILQREVKAGHQIAIHTWSHTALTTQTNEEIIAELKWTELAIKTATGLTPRYMRPPYGDFDDRVRAICTQLGYKIVIWDKDTNDWTSADDPKFNLNWIEGNFTQWVKENDPTGHISLEHDLYNQTAAQGPKAAQIVTGAGFSIKPVAQCVGDLYPYLESTPTTAAAPASTDAYPTATISAPNPTGQVDYSDSTSSPTPTPNIPDSSSTTSTTSNAISHMKNNYYLSSLVFFIVLFLVI